MQHAWCTFAGIYQARLPTPGNLGPKVGGLHDMLEIYGRFASGQTKINTTTPKTEQADFLCEKVDD